jgi:hypothetical protein
MRTREGKIANLYFLQTIWFCLVLKCVYYISDVRGTQIIYHEVNVLQSSHHNWWLFTSGIDSIVECESEGVKFEYPHPVIAFRSPASLKMDRDNAQAEGEFGLGNQFWIRNYAENDTNIWNIGVLFFS